jgi:hypothetical protein
MGRKRLFARLVGGACLAAAAMALLWPGTPAGPGVIDGQADPMAASLAASDRKWLLKAAVISDVVAGRLTLAAAVDRFEEIEGQFPELAEQTRRQLECAYAGRTIRERLAYSVLSYTEARLRDQPYWADIVLGRLERELAVMIGPPHGQRDGR